MLYTKYYIFKLTDFIINQIKKQNNVNILISYYDLYIGYSSPLHMCDCHCYQSNTVSSLLELESNC